MLRLLKIGLSREYGEPRMFRRPGRLRDAYDVAIIGGGHGLAAVCYFARDHGVRNLAVLEKGYIGGGNTGRNTNIRSNYLTPDGVQFYDESVRRWQDSSADFDLNLFYSTRGHYTLAHTDASLRTLPWRAEANKHYGLRSEVVAAAFVKRSLPMMGIECGGHASVLGAVYHEPGAIARHDAGHSWGLPTPSRGRCLRSRRSVRRRRAGPEVQREFFALRYEREAMMTMMIGVAVVAVSPGNGALRRFRTWCDPSYGDHFESSLRNVAANIGDMATATHGA